VATDHVHFDLGYALVSYEVVVIFVGRNHLEFLIFFLVGRVHPELLRLLMGQIHEARGEDDGRRKPPR
jgi:hypothetical protein